MFNLKDGNAGGSGARGDTGDVGLNGAQGADGNAGQTGGQMTKDDIRAIILGTNFLNIKKLHFNYLFM